MKRFPLPSGAQGFAAFDSATHPRRRYWLERRWDGATEASPYAFWLCMNPSMAGADLDDPTVGRLYGFTRRFQLSRFIIANIADYIATKPEELLLPTVSPSSDGNLDRVLRFAQHARVTIVGTGDVPRVIRSLSRHTITLLRDRGVPLYCLGLTRLLDAKHPLFIAGQAAFREYTETPNAH